MDEKEIVFNRAKNAMLSRDFTLAARLFKSLLADDPNNLELLNSLGQLYIKASDDEKALPFYEKIIKLKWIHKDENTKVIRLVEEEKYPEDYEIRWYRWALGASSPD